MMLRPRNIESRLNRLRNHMDQQKRGSDWGPGTEEQNLRSGRNSENETLRECRRQFFRLFAF